MIIKLQLIIYIIISIGIGQLFNHRKTRVYGYIDIRDILVCGYLGDNWLRSHDSHHCSSFIKIAHCDLNVMLLGCGMTTLTDGVQ